MDDDDDTGERRKPDMANKREPEALGRGLTETQSQSPDAERAEPPNGEEPDQNRHPPAALNSSSSPEPRFATIARPQQADKNLGNLAESPELRSTLEELFRGIIREETRPFKDKRRNMHKPKASCQTY